MVISKAKPSDVKKIMDLADSLRFNPKNPINSSLITNLSEEEYLRRVKDSDYFYVYTEGDDLVGFLMCIDDSLFKKLVNNKKFNHKEMIPFLEDFPKPFVYGGSMGVNPKFRNKGVGSKLVKQWIEDMKKNNVSNACVMIRHYPKRNDDAIRFVTKHGFFFGDEEVINEEIIHGIYIKK